MAGPFFYNTFLNIIIMAETKKPKEEQVTKSSEEQVAKSSEEKANPTPKEKTSEQIIRELTKEKEALEMKLMSVDRADAAQAPDEVLLAMEQMRKELDEIKNRPIQVQAVDGKKQKYQQKDIKDLLPDGEGVTFTARYVMKAIPGYIDKNGMEVVAPYNIILMRYAASDQRMDGKEEEIINFCNYTTRWKKEIDFLRNHPEFGVTFGDNMDKVAGHNPREYQFRVMAGHEVAGMSPESVISYATQYKIKGSDKMSIKQLKPFILEAMVLDYMEQQKVLNTKIQERIFQQAGKHI